MRGGWTIRGLGQRSFDVLKIEGGVLGVPVGLGAQHVPTEDEEAGAKSQVWGKSAVYSGVRRQWGCWRRWRWRRSACNVRPGSWPG